MGIQLRQRLDELDGPGQRAARRRRRQVRHGCRRPGIHEGEQVGFGQRLLFDLVTEAHPAAHVALAAIGERQAADAPAHGQVASEFRSHALDEGQLVAILGRFHVRCGFGLHLHDRLTRAAEAALHQRHRLPLLQHPAEHLAHRLALAQQLGFEAGRHLRLQRADEGGRQGPHRPARLHLGTHGLEGQRCHHTAEHRSSLAPGRRHHQFGGAAVCRLDHLGKVHLESL
ncbi:hypothetical protein D9M71_242890 [compost metagenome]